MSIAEKLVTIAENETKVYDAGKHKGTGDFWAGLLSKGNRVQCNNMFFQCDFNVVGGFNPPITIKPANAETMFRGAKGLGIITTEKLDTSNLSNDPLNMFGQIPGAYLYEIEEISFVKLATVTSAFNMSMGLTRIGKLILKDDGTTVLGSSLFTNCINLKEITIEGTVGNTIKFAASPLTPASMKSVIAALADYSTENTGVHTVTFTTNCWTELEAESTPKDEGIDFEGTWKEYVYAKGWNY